MIEAHTVDAWTRLSPTVRRTIAFRDATVLGGFAAPLFLWLAGLAVVLAATRAAERTGSRRAAVEMICRRGLEIFILGFLFRAAGVHHHARQPSGDAVSRRHPQHHGTGDCGRRHRLGAGADHVDARVRATRRSPRAFAMLTPIVRASPAIDAWPLWLQWYMRPFGEFTIFTLFPWAGFVFAGGAVGALIAAARDARAERRLHVDPRRDRRGAGARSASTPPAGRRSTPPRRSGPARRPGSRSASGS